MAIVKVVPMPGPGGSGSGFDTGNFIFDNDRMSTNQPMTIGVNGVPADITLTAYLGTKLQFANTPGAGLSFPDGTVQTTAYTGESSVKTWTAPNSALYEIRQAHGGVEVSTESAAEHLFSQAYVNTNQLNASVVSLNLDIYTESLLIPIYNGSVFRRNIKIIVNGQEHNVLAFYPEGPQQWVFEISSVASFYVETYYDFYLAYGGAPVAWWDSDSLNIMPEGDEWKFRGAKVDYHAYSTDSGTIIGTIYIAHDSGDHNVTHLETGSGGNDLGSVQLWYRDPSNYVNERKLYVYRADGEGSTTRVQWTAQLYYGTELYD